MEARGAEAGGKGAGCVGGGVGDGGPGRGGGIDGRRGGGVGTARRLPLGLVLSSSWAPMSALPGSPLEHDGPASLLHAAATRASASVGVFEASEQSPAIASNASLSLSEKPWLSPPVQHPGSGRGRDE